MKIVLFSAALAACSLASAATPIDGWYSSVFGGPAYVPGHVSITSSRSALTHDGDNFHWGYNVGGRLGYQSTPIRYEAELTYINTPLEDFRLANIRQDGVSGGTWAAMAMANIYYDFPDMVPAVSPYLGVGLGYAYVETRLDSLGPPLPSNFKGSDSVFAYQVTGGFSYNYTESYTANLSGRYVGTQKADSVGKTFQAYIASAGILYRFDGANYK